MFSARPVLRSSTTCTEWPWDRRNSTRCDPMKPAPPVTRMRIIQLVLELCFGLATRAGKGAIGMVYSLGVRCRRTTAGVPAIAPAGHAFADNRISTYPNRGNLRKIRISLAEAYAEKVSNWLPVPGGAFRSARSSTELGWQIGEEAGPESAPRQSLTTISAR